MIFGLIRASVPTAHRMCLFNRWSCRASTTIPFDIRSVSIRSSSNPSILLRAQDERLRKKDHSNHEAGLENPAYPYLMKGLKIIDSRDFRVPINQHSIRLYKGIKTQIQTHHRRQSCSGSCVISKSGMIQELIFMMD